jgi:hypothetical protein
MVWRFPGVVMGYEPALGGAAGPALLGLLSLR